MKSMLIPFFLMATMSFAQQGSLVRLPEIPDDPYVPVSRDAMSRSPGFRSFSDGFFFTQVNVDADGQNIVGDAGNEPSIAVNPNDLTSIAIGWRQFDTITNNFRQAGYGYTTDGGLTWTFPGVIEPGIFRSDPVLDFDADGAFYYNSLTSVGGNFSCNVFKSVDGGATWDAGTFAWGGDKQWMVIDRTDGLGDGNIYSSWTVFFSSCDPGHFTRSPDGGATYDPCEEIPGLPYWGTLNVGPDGDLYVGGASQIGGFIVTRSTNAQDPGQTVIFDDEVAVDLGGEVAGNQGNSSPNPDGILGQVWVATDHSTGPTAGNVYLLCSAEPDASPDPLNVMFARSTDGGQTWSAPVRVNDDTGNEWQWFGTMSVAPTGRIDVIWLDTRDDPGTVLSSLYYSASNDGGVTWTPNERLTDSFDPHLGWPQQDKMGDYFHMVSDSIGAHLAWAATFNGEQDVYYARILAGEFIPAAPVLSSPPDGSDGQPLEVTLIWDASIGATGYHVQVDTDPGFPAPIVDDSTLTTTRKDISGLATGTTYHWRVSARSSSGSGPWSDVWDFTTGTNPPAAPVLVYPEDGAQGIPTTVTLEWEDTASGATWGVQVSADEEFLTLVVDDEAIEMTYEVSGLAGEVLYYWRVNTRTSGGTSLWSDVWEFTTLPEAPAAPLLVAPPNGFVSSNSLIFFRWNLVTGADTYHFQLATDDSFSMIVEEDSALTGTTNVVTDLTNGTYFWRVSAGNAGGSSDWSDVWSVTILVTSIEETRELPEEFSLGQNYPNPFNPTTVIPFAVPQASEVLIEVFDIVGRRVAVLASGEYEPGYYRVQFDASRFGGGVYFSRMRSGSFEETRKLILIR